MRTNEELSGVSLLGNTRTDYPADYAPQVLETFVNKHPENEYLVTLNCPEFTSLCPKKYLSYCFIVHLCSAPCCEVIPGCQRDSRQPLRS